MSNKDQGAATTGLFPGHGPEPQTRLLVQWCFAGTIFSRTKWLQSRGQASTPANEAKDRWTLAQGSMLDSLGSLSSRQAWTWPPYGRVRIDRHGEPVSGQLWEVSP